MSFHCSDGICTNKWGRMLGDEQLHVVARDRLCNPQLGAEYIETVWNGTKLGAEVDTMPRQEDNLEALFEAAQATCNSGTSTTEFEPALAVFAFLVLSRRIQLSTHGGTTPLGWPIAEAPRP